MKKITSITMHTTSEGQRLSYTYSEVDENTGAVISSNNRESLVVLDIPANAAALKHIDAVKEYVSGKLESRV